MERRTVELSKKISKTLEHPLEDAAYIDAMFTNMKDLTFLADIGLRGQAKLQVKRRDRCLRLTLLLRVAFRSDNGELAK